MTERPKDRRGGVSLKRAERALEIRPATVDDAAAIARVHVQAWQVGYAGLMSAAYLHGLDWRERAGTWRERLQNPAAGVGYLIATRGRVLGFCAFGPARDEDLPAGTSGEVYAINVHSSAWSTGAGGGLLLGACDSLSVYDVVVLWVLAENTRARRFYERRGFVADGARKTIEIGGADLTELRYRRAG